MDFDHVPARYHIARAEVLQDDAPHWRQLLRVDLHQIPGPLDPPEQGFPGGPRAMPQPLPSLSAQVGRVR